MTFALTLDNAKRYVWQIIRKNRKKILLLCVFLTLIFVIAIVGAVIYNSMFMESGIGVKQ